MPSIKAALFAALITTAVAALPAQAAFVTYTFIFDGTGTYSYYNGNTIDLKTDNLKGSTVSFGLNVPNDVWSTLYSYGSTTEFVLSAANGAFSYSFSPTPFQSSQYAIGSGTACLANVASSFPTATSHFDQSCGDISYVNSSKRSIERFSGKLVSAVVTREDADGFEFFQTVGYAPEPSSWALMLAGFGMVGASLRYRRKSTAVSFA